jgi:hypothetical protein
METTLEPGGQFTAPHAKLDISISPAHMSPVYFPGSLVVSAPQLPGYSFSQYHLTSIRRKGNPPIPAALALKPLACP